MSGASHGSNGRASRPASPIRSNNVERGRLPAAPDIREKGRRHRYRSRRSTSTECWRCVNPTSFYRASFAGVWRHQGLRLRPDAHSQSLTAVAATTGTAPPRPIPIKDRASILFIEKGQLDVLDGAFVVVDRTGVRTHIPVGGLACHDAGARRAHLSRCRGACRTRRLSPGVDRRGGCAPLFGRPAGRGARRPASSPSTPGARPGCPL